MVFELPMLFSLYTTFFFLFLFNIHHFLWFGVEGNGFMNIYDEARSRVLGRRYKEWGHDSGTLGSIREGCQDQVESLVDQNQCQQSRTISSQSDCLITLYKTFLSQEHRQFMVMVVWGRVKVVTLRKIYFANASACFSIL